jgi:hypothetical protein
VSSYAVTGYYHKLVAEKLEDLKTLFSTNCADKRLAEVVAVGV